MIPSKSIVPVEYGVLFLALAAWCLAIVLLSSMIVCVDKTAMLAKCDASTGLG